VPEEKIPPVLRLGLTLMAQVSATVAMATARPAYLPLQRLCKRKEGSRQTCKNSLFYFLFCCMILSKKSAAFLKTIS